MFVRNVLFCEILDKKRQVRKESESDSRTGIKIKNPLIKK